MILTKYSQLRIRLVFYMERVSGEKKQEKKVADVFNLFCTCRQYYLQLDVYSFDVVFVVVFFAQADLQQINFIGYSMNGNSLSPIFTIHTNIIHKGSQFVYSCALVSIAIGEKLIQRPRESSSETMIFFFQRYGRRAYAT